MRHRAISIWFAMLGAGLLPVATLEAIQESVAKLENDPSHALTRPPRLPIIPVAVEQADSSEMSDGEDSFRSSAYNSINSPFPVDPALAGRRPGAATVFFSPHSARFHPLKLGNADDDPHSPTND